MSLTSEPSSLCEITAAGFQPWPFITNGHLQTIVGNFLRRTHSLPPSETRMVEVTPAHQEHGEGVPASFILCHCNWQAEQERVDALTVIAVHGLEGSSDSHYILGVGSKAWAAGCNVVRMNMRNCGNTEHLTPTLYHSGLSDDVGAVVRSLVRVGCRRIALVGYSMGGNLVLKYAAEVGKSVPELKGVVAVSPAADLAATSAAIHQIGNRLYERRFLNNMLRRYRRKATLFPHLYSLQLPAIRSIRDYDEHIVARYAGFSGADDYYARAAAGPIADRIQTPTLILHALDDPFIRVLPETRARYLANRYIRYIETRHGGHCAFLTSATGGTNNRYWAEMAAVRFLMDASDVPATMDAAETRAPLEARN